MDKMLFDDLVQSLKEARAIAKGEAKAWRGSGFVIPTQTLCTQARDLPSHKTLRTGLKIPSGGRNHLHRFRPPTPSERPCGSVGAFDRHRNAKRR